MKVDQTSTRRPTRKSGMLLHIDLDQAPVKNNEVRMAVRDNRTGNVGTLTAPVQ